MEVLALCPKEDELRVIEKDRPVPAEDEALIRTLAVGIDGTDRRIAAGKIGGTPPGDEDHLVLGHEAVGVVEDPNGTVLEEGDLVVPLVRRPAEGGERYAKRGELDMAPPEAVHERGIFGAHGYLAEYFTCDAAYLVPVPESLRDSGFFVEPASIIEKSLEQAFAARSEFDWDPERALVLGNGNLGLLALARVATHEKFAQAYCLGRRDRPDPTIEFVERASGTYVDTRKTPVAEIPTIFEPVDYIFEATGHPPFATAATQALGPNGVLTLQGIPGSSTHEFDAGDYHTDLVVENKAVLGVVNSRRVHFEAAAKWLDDISEELIDNLVTGVYGLDEFERGFIDTPETIKTVISFD